MWLHGCTSNPAPTIKPETHPVVTFVFSFNFICSIWCGVKTIVGFRPRPIGCNSCLSSSSITFILKSTDKWRRWLVWPVLVVDFAGRKSYSYDAKVLVVQMQGCGSSNDWFWNNGRTAVSGIKIVVQSGLQVHHIKCCRKQCSRQKHIFHLPFEFKFYLALKTQWCRLKHCFRIQYDVSIFSLKGTLVILKPSHEPTAHHLEKITSHIEIIK